MRLQTTNFSPSGILALALTLTLCAQIHATDPTKQEELCSADLDSQARLELVEEKLRNPGTMARQALYAINKFIKPILGTGDQKAEEWERLMAYYNSERKKRGSLVSFEFYRTSIDGGHWILWGDVDGKFVVFHRDGRMIYINEGYRWPKPVLNQTYVLDVEKLFAAPPP